MRHGALASAWLGEVLAGRIPMDTALSHLEAITHVEWIDLLAGARSLGALGIRLFLPRPGDPRGHRCPDATAATAAAVLGWIGSDGITAWTTVTEDRPWTVLPGPPVAVLLPSPAEADRQLRATVLRVAEDLAALDQHVDAPERRGLIAREVRTWTDAPLDPDRAALAARAVPLLLASAHAPEAGVTAHAQEARRSTLMALDPAVRTGVEVAYSRIP